MILATGRQVYYSPPPAIALPAFLTGVVRGSVVKCNHGAYLDLERVMAERLGAD
jgi:hypothetical protein